MKNERRKKIVISDVETIAIVESMQRRIKTAGIDASCTEIVQMCIGLAKKRPEEWVVWIE